MLKIKQGRVFGKDVKRMVLQGRDIMKMFYPLFVLLNSQPLSPQYRDHPLKGKWKGYRDFHIEPNWVVIYRITEDFLFLARTGTHSEILDE
jgi:mRNA interferase YafQ